MHIDHGICLFPRQVGNLREAFAWVDGYLWMRLPIFKQKKSTMIGREKPGQPQLLPG